MDNSLNHYYIRITNNSEKYIDELKIKDKITINQNDLSPSGNLLKRSDPLWGYYNVKSFKIGEKEFTLDSLFSNYYIFCGDCFMGECYLKKVLKKQLL